MKLRGQTNGYAMVALLVAISIMTVMMSMAMPVWKTATQREKEAELIFRGQQYARAIELYQRKLPGAAPPNLNVLLDQKFLRKKYKDPITNDDFELLGPNSPGAIGPPQAPGQRGGGPASTSTSGIGQGTSRLNQGSGQATNRPNQAANQAQFGTTPQRGGGAGGSFGVQAGIVGVASKSKATSLRLYNGRNHYNEWQFVYVPRATAPGAGGVPGVGGPGQPGRGGPGRDGGRGFPPGFGDGRGFGGRGDGRGFPPGFGDGRGFGGRGDGRGFPPNAPNQPPGGRGFSNPGGQPFNPGGQPFPQQPRPPGN